jgi:cyclic pyranopterin phosphate synthase
LASGQNRATDAAPIHVLTDQLQRPLRDLRVSVTDRCNFRCTYCMPKEVFGRDYDFLPRAEILTFEEITRLVRVFVALGVEKVRLTGGEPLLRKDIEHLIAELAAIDGLDDLTLTTNGSFLAQKADALRAAGLKRLTVSLDALDEATFAAMNDVGFPVARVLEGIDTALKAGFGPIKNQRGDPPRRQRTQHQGLGTALPRTGVRRPVHRVHGRRPQQRLAAR